MQAAMEQEGVATFFCTFSFADSYWPELARLMPPKSYDGDDKPARPPSTLTERYRAVLENPHIASAYFAYRCQAFLNAWMVGKNRPTWYWYRYFCLLFVLVLIFK